MVKGNFRVSRRVLSFIMRSSSSASRVPECLILIGGCFFIFVLGISAFWEPDIRWLHFFQAWMYVATIVLSFRQSRWGHFIGISAAGLWNYANIFATTFFFNGWNSFLDGRTRVIWTGRICQLRCQRGSRIFL